MTLFNFSNPLLHASKLLNYWDYKRARNGAFLLFGIVFFASRLVIFPSTVMKATFVKAVWCIPGLLTHFRVLYVLFNSLLLLLYALQIKWLAGIIRVLRAAFRGNEADVVKEQAKDDPASVPDGKFR